MPFLPKSVNMIRFFKKSNSLIITAGVMSIVCFILLGLLLWRGAYPTPFKNEFYFVSLYNDALKGVLSFDELFRPHNGHIYVLLKLLLWVVVYFRIDLRVLMYAQSIMISLTAGLIAYVVYRDRESRLGLVTAIIVALAVCSARQYENLYWAMQISYAAMMFFTVVAFVFTERFARNNNLGSAGIAMVLAFLAMLSVGAGIVSFVLVAIAIYMTSGSNRRTKAISVVGTIVGLLVFILPQVSTLENIKNAQSDTTLLSVGNIAVYLLAFFANTIFSFSVRGDDLMSLALGILLLTVTLWLLIRLRHDWRNNLLPFLLVAFALATAILISVARLKNGIWQPNAPRYYPLALPLLIGAMLLLFRVGRLMFFDRVIFGVFLISMLTSSVYAYLVEWKTTPYRLRSLSMAHISLCSGQTVGLAFDGDIEQTNLDIMRRAFCKPEDIVQSHKITRALLFLKDFGPRDIYAGKDFNVQPDGMSAIWANSKNATPTTVLVLGGERLRSTVNEDGSLVTAGVPRHLYAQKGEYSLYLFDPVTGKKSNELRFVVR